MSILDDSLISGRYLFPQPRRIAESFFVPVNGAKLACYRKIVNPDNLTLVHFHGNGEAVADYVPFFSDVFAELGLNSLFVEYRQYGRSTGEAQLVKMLDDGEAVLKAAQLSPETVVVFGRSIGSLYAIELAYRQPTVAGLILESGIADPADRFLTYADLSAASFDKRDVLAEVKQHFDHATKLSAYTNPLLILHTQHDGLIDISHAERNHRWAGSVRKQLVLFPEGNHNTIFPVNMNEYVQVVSDFVRQLSSP